MKPDLALDKSASGQPSTQTKNGGNNTLELSIIIIIIK